MVRVYIFRGRKTYLGVVEDVDEPGLLVVEHGSKYVRRLPEDPIQKLISFLVKGRGAGHGYTGRA